MSTQSKSINKLSEVHDAQVKKGLETYGKLLHPFNGRSAYTDAMEEIVDIAAYVTQLEQERTTLILALESMYGACSTFLVSSYYGPTKDRERFKSRVDSIVDMLGEVGYVIGKVPMGETFNEFSEVINELKGVDDYKVFSHMPEVSAEIMDGDEDIDDTPEVIPTCPKCKDELEWDSGDSDVGWPGQWYCVLCDREGVVEDEV